MRPCASCNGETVWKYADRISARVRRVHALDDVRRLQRDPSDGQSRERSEGAEYRVLRSAGKVSFLIASPGGPEGRLAVTLGPAVRRSGADVVALWHHAELEN
jgi:hypothetical protein